MNRLEFVLPDQHRKLNENVIRQLPINELLSYECPMTIMINDRVFFNDPFFCILEFWKSLAEWDKTHTFDYHSIETDENPLIRFVRTPDGWLLRSPWSVFNADEYLLSTEDLCIAISALEKQLFVSDI